MSPNGTTVFDADTDDEYFSDVPDDAFTPDYDCWGLECEVVDVEECTAIVYCTCSIFGFETHAFMDIGDVPGCSA